MDNNRLGQYVQNLRLTKGISTRQLGKIAECDHSLITRLEAGTRVTSLDRLWRIIEELNGDYGQALYLLCLDAGVPEKVARRATAQDTNQDRL